MQNFTSPMIQDLNHSMSLNRPVKRFLSLALLCFSVIGAGCSDATEEGPALFPVKGTVTFDGEAVKEGRIQFRSATSNGAAYSAEIKEGAYKLDAEAGKMKVEIIASRIVPGKFSEPASPDEEPQPLGEMYIPEQYNSKTTLEAEIKVDGANDFPFTLTSK